MEASSVLRGADAPRCCFICLQDEESSDPPGSWVDPCPCMLEAHQDCMLSFVTNCVRSNRPFECPVCRFTIEMEAIWDPIVMLHDVVAKRFTKTSPLVLFTAMSAGVQFSMQMYGAIALWTFSGKDVMMRFVMGPDMMIDGKRAELLAFAGECITNALVLMNVAPALLVGRLLPGWANKVFLPAAAFYGIYHVMRVEQFFTWPPSPQLAMAVFPYMRFAYYNMYEKLVMPYETKLNHQLLGLPPIEPRAPTNENQANNNRGEQHQGNDRNVARAQGILGMLQTFIDALEQNERFMLEVAEVSVEEMGNNEAGEAGQGDLADPIQPATVPIAEPAAALGAAAVEEAAAVDVVEPAPEPPAPNYEAPPAVTYHLNLGTLLFNVSNAIVNALILPGVSFAAGEALRLVLPRKWTAAPLHHPWMRVGTSSSSRRPGIFQQQWGRSLVGGCLFTVILDMLRVYTKKQKVAALLNRRVKNVDRPRRKKE